MDKFLELAFTSQIADVNREYNDKVNGIVDEFTDELKKYLSSEITEELAEELFGVVSQISKLSGTEGMKLAIGIMNGTYIPVV